MKKNTLLLTQGALIAAIYVALTYLQNLLLPGTTSMAIQVRVSEALCILPVFTPAAVPGLFVGCLLANTLTGCALPDIIFGSLATLIGAFGTYFLRKSKFVFTLPPVISNMVIIPLMLIFAYGVDNAYWYLVVTVGLGEIISICVIGFILKKALSKYKNVIFKNEI